MLDHTDQLGREDVVSSVAGFPVVMESLSSCSWRNCRSEEIHNSIKNFACQMLAINLLRGAEVIVVHALHSLEPRLMSPRAGPG